LIGKRETALVNNIVTLRDVEGAATIKTPAKHALKFEREVKADLICDYQ
jgi:hypothetical protein